VRRGEIAKRLRKHGHKAGIWFSASPRAYATLGKIGCEGRSTIAAIGRSQTSPPVSVPSQGRQILISQACHDRGRALVETEPCGASGKGQPSRFQPMMAPTES